MDDRIDPWIRGVVALLLFVFLLTLSCITFNEVMHRVSGKVMQLSSECKDVKAQKQAADAPAGDKQMAAKADACNAQQVRALSTLAALCGALGATLHALGSLVAFTGNGKFTPSWAAWYVAQPVRGALLSAGASWLIQIGQLDDKGVAATPTGLMGITFLIGLFSDPAIEKLRELFGVLFQTGTSPRKGAPSTELRKPAIASVNFTRGGPNQLSMKINGSGFDAQDEVRINDQVQAVPTKRSDACIELDLPPALSAPGTALKIIVTPVQGNATPSNIHATKAP